MSNFISLDQLRIADAPERRDRTRPPRHRPGERFLKGPVPLAWLERAMLIRGRALHVAIVLWYVAGLRCSPHMAVSMSSFKKYGFSRHTASRALEALERARLIDVRRAPGRKPRVTILDCPERPS